MDHYQVQAAAAYKRKDYMTALQLYTKAIARTQSAQLYRDRAACQGKLGAVTLALADAKKCIKAAPTDPAGYVCAGKFLIKMDEKKTALEVMAYGLRKVKHAGQSFQVLQQAHNDLLAEIKPTNSVDPMTILPRELAVYILEQLDFRQRMNACSVSKGWYDFIHAVPSLWEHLDLSAARRKVRHAFIVRAVKTARNRIMAVTLNKLFDFDKAALILLRNCPVESLTFGPEVPRLGSNVSQLLQYASHLKHVDLRHITQSCSVMFEIMTTLSNRLNTLMFSSIGIGCGWRATVTNVAFPNLKHLEIVFQGVQMFSSGFQTALPNLETLIVCAPGGRGSPQWREDFREFTRLRHIDVRCPGYSLEIAGFPITLRTIKLHCHTALISPEVLWWQYAVRDIEELHLQVGYCTDIKPSSDSAYPAQDASHQHDSRLQRLDYARYSFANASSEDVEAFCKQPWMKNLQHIGLQEALFESDDFVSTMVQNLPHLTSIDLSSTRITGVGVKAAVDGAAHLKDLVLNNCHMLGEDAVHWARSKGIRVQFRKTEALEYERKIRQ